MSGVANARRIVARAIEGLWTSAESACREKILNSLPTDQTLRLLDVGCDDGAWTERLRRQMGIPAAHVQGLEVVEARAAVARSRGFDVRVGDLEQRWPFDDGSVDVVHANQVIEHVKRLDHFVQEAHRVLAARGHAVVCSENLASWHNVAALALGYQPFSITNISDMRPIGNPFALHAGKPNEQSESWQHVHVMTLAALRDIFAAHNFEIVTSWGTGYHPLPGRVAARLSALDPRHAHFICIVARTDSGRSPH